MNKVTILVNSCDKYEDAWEPFFKILKINWPECEQYRIILNTETKVYNCDFLNIETVCGGKERTWSERLKFALSHIETDFILYMLEDFFLLEKVSHDTFLEALDVIKKGDVGYIGLKYQEKREYRNPDDEDNTQRFINKDKVVSVNRINSMTALWKKSWLETLIRDHETPWEFELYGSERSRRTPEKVLIINNSDGACPCVFNYNVDIQYGHGLTCGGWLPKNIELFEKYGIKVNFENLGIKYKIYYDAIGIPYEDENNKIKETTKSLLREYLYKIKHRIKVHKKNIEKQKRKEMSLK